MNIKYYIGMTLVALSFNSYALRCNTSIIDIGSPISQVMTTCQIDSVYHVANNNADITHVYIKQNGMASHLTVIDGVVVTLEQVRL